MRMAQQTEIFFPQFEGKKLHNLSSGSHSEILSRLEVLLGIPDPKSQINFYLPLPLQFFSNKKTKIPRLLVPAQAS